MNDKAKLEPCEFTFTREDARELAESSKRLETAVYDALPEGHAALVVLFREKGGFSLFAVPTPNDGNVGARQMLLDAARAVESEQPRLIPVTLRRFT